MRNSFAFRNSVSPDRSGMAASRFLAAAAASVRLLCLEAESRKSHCNWLSESFECLKSASKSSFFLRGRRDLVLELQFM